jgi:CDP-glucose 4,6-dehydratase
VGSLGWSEVLRAYAGKRVFVTGHTGFKGTWLSMLLHDLGAEVMGYALPPEPGPSHFAMLGLDKKIGSVFGDIRDFTALDAALGAFKPDYVFHMAAQALVRRSYADPVNTISTNVVGSTHVMEAVRRCDSVRSFVYITSDKCYENVEWVWGYRETDALGGHDPYSASKAAAEIVFSAYARSFFAQRPALGAATTRAGNVIGGGDWAADRIVPDIVRAIEAGQPVKLRNPLATRPWQHVLEPLGGYIMLGARLHAEPQKFRGAWNFGPTTQKVRTVHEVTQSIVAQMKRGSIELAPDTSGQHEAHLLQLNCDKAHQELHWYPRWDVDQTLAATAGWYAAVLNGEPAESVTRRQIRDYFPELT